MWSCPTHEDAEPSLSVSEGDDGRALVKCHAGCQTETVVSALGLSMADLFVSKPKTSRREIVATYRYRKADGELLFEVLRFEPKEFAQRRPDGNGGHVWNLHGVEPVLFRLPELIKGVAEGRTAYFVEGEKDVLAFQKRGHCATCNPGGAGKWRPQFARIFEGAQVVIVADDDEPGERQALAVAASLEGVAASVSIVKAARGKDASDHFDAGLRVEDFVDWSPEHGQVDHLSSLLAEVRMFLCKYVALTDAQATAVTLWVVVTWLVEWLETAPYLAITSPEKRSGKSRLLEALALVVRLPWYAVLPSEAVVFRKISSDTPTLLLDECDAIWSGRGPSDKYEGLRGMINAGHRSGATVPRCVPPKFEVRDFAVFCLKAIAAIGKVPDTISDRAIPIRLHRRRPDQRVARFRQRDTEAETAELRERLALWATTAETRAIAESRPEIPDALHDRAADVWEPLLAVADAAGGDWPSHARRAAIELHDPENEVEDGTLGIRLLAEVLTVFADRGDPPTMHTETLLEALHAMEEAPWSDLRGKPIDSRKVARLLRPYGPRPGSVRVGQRVAKGWRRENFEDAWSRYLPRNPSEPAPQGSQGHNGTETGTCTDSADPGVTHVNPRNRSEMNDCDAVTFLNPETGDAEPSRDEAIPATPESNETPQHPSGGDLAASSPVATSIEFDGDVDAFMAAAREQHGIAPGGEPAIDEATPGPSVRPPASGSRAKR
jgi:hypothetical protein